MQDSDPEAETMAPDGPTPPATGASGEPVGLRTHPLTGLVQGSLFAGAATVALLGRAIAGGDGGRVPIWVDALVSVGGGLVIGIGLGYVTWFFTRYVIDGAELRITKGVLQKSSRRIPYERIQSVDIAEPFLARVVGLAELRIEMAGGRNARTSLRFLPLDDSRALRRLLLDRAHGREHDAGVTVDEEASHELITTVSPRRVVIGTLLTLDFVVSAVGTVVVVVLALWFGQVVAFLGGIVPLATWLVQIVGKRVVMQWDFTLTRSDNGVRIERGLLSRTSQSIPFARVQGVSVEEPYVWRRFGWQRLEVDVAGYAAQGRDDSTPTSSTLLPIADPDLTASVLDELVPGARPGEIGRVSASPRSWVFAPIGWRYRWVGADADAFVARTGWLSRSTDVVPHARTQSVELRQGPWQRRRGVATVEVHTPKGPVDADGRHLDAADARRVALDQLTRARQART